MLDPHIKKIFRPALSTLIFSLWSSRESTPITIIDDWFMLRVDPVDPLIDASADTPIDTPNAC
jgi:hypothetical protein